MCLGKRVYLETENERKRVCACVCVYIGGWVSVFEQEAIVWK